MSRSVDILITALAPVIWGSTYYVTTEMLPPGYPLTASMLRALPAGLLILLITRSVPTGVWLWRSFILGALNFTIFLSLLFIAAYRLPGGIAATIMAMQPLIAAVLAWALLSERITPLTIGAGALGFAGVAMLTLTNQATLDTVGIVASIAAAISMATGIVLTFKWKPQVSTLAFTGWQMSAGGLLLVPLVLWFEPSLPPLSTANILGFAYMGLFSGAISYFLWFRGIARLGSTAAASMILLSPVTAIVLGLVLLNETFTPVQTVGIVLVIASVWCGTAKKR